MNGLPTWLRVWLAGMLWGTLCGVAAAMTTIAALALSGLAADGFYWGGMYDFVVGLLVASMLGCMYGSVIGFALGFLTGLVAGPVLEVALWLLAPRAAAPAAATFVLLVQFGIGLALADQDVWLSLVVPAISGIPMWLVMRRAVRVLEQAEHGQRRDTLAA